MPQRRPEKQFPEIDFALRPVNAISTGPAHGPSQARSYFLGKLTSTRRFFRRPSSVPLSAIGYCSP